MTQHNEDAAWATAWAWVQREHDRERFSDDARARMMEWLAADPAHRRAYDKAARLWLLAGLVPPVNDLDGAPEPSPPAPWPRDATE
ncbi:MULTISPECIES: DUF4880 domain-containing protein [unclassified Cupriavidus]|uniref:DUF4880 domain-containing protein n=1 Tax=unclassified Cupriavidus TaxID=2640874 RepID=UPI0010F80A6E|nr:MULTISPECIES: DUF4880 domain-containing protein [unclassified Cupriavidus]MWL86924.1 DUF4880 domain-containing protein [Cupriavidus sp. SW-Y-13]